MIRILKAIVLILLVGLVFSERGEVFTQGEPVRASTQWITDLESAIRYMELSPDKKHVLVLVRGMAYVLDAATGAIELQVETHQAVVWAEWRSDGSQFAILQWWDTPVQVIDFPSGDEFQIEIPSAMSIVWHPDLPLLYVSGYIEEGEVGFIWDTERDEIVMELPLSDSQSYTRLQWDVVTSILAVSNDQEGPITVDTSQWEITREYSFYPADQQIWSIIPNASFTQFLVTRLRVREDVTAVSIVDVEGEQEIAALDVEFERDLPWPYYKTLRGVGWSPDDQYVWTEAYDGVVRIWDTTTYTEVLRIFDFRGALRLPQITWNHDSTAILVANGRDIGGACQEYGCLTTVQIVDLATGEPTYILRGHHMSATFADWGADETQVITSGEDGTVRLWDLEQAAPYPGCDPALEFIPGERIEFSPPTDEAHATYAALNPSSATVSVIAPDDMIIIYDGPRCIDGQDWYAVYHPMPRDSGPLGIGWMPTGDAAGRWLAR